MCDYIEKLNNTFIYAPHPILKPIRQIFFLSLEIVILESETQNIDVSRMVVVRL